MRQFTKIFVCVALGLALSCTILAAQQKVVKQKVRPVTTMDKAVYKQKVEQLRAMIRQDQKQLKADRLQYGKGSAQIKNDRAQLRRDEKALKQLQKIKKQTLKAKRKKIG
jgi:hypothetical protein